MKLRIGTRGSPLALAQTELVRAALNAAHPAVEVEPVIIRTEGDRRRRASLLAIGGQGVFTRELEIALLDGAIDVAVHSLKDLPSGLPYGLVLAATLLREDPRDVLVTRESSIRLATLPRGAVIGTGSLRRRAQLLALRPDLMMRDIRGNVETRLARMIAGDYDAIVLAAAGLNRLGIAQQMNLDYLDMDIVLPAPAQAIIGLECREDDRDTRVLLDEVNHADTFAAATAERAVLQSFGTGCRLPIAAHATTAGGELSIRARVLSEDGSTSYTVTSRGATSSAQNAGQQAADWLIEQGALELLDTLSSDMQYGAREVQ